MNTKILSKAYSFKVWNELQYKSLDFNMLGKVFNGFLYTYGYTEGKVNFSNTLANVMAFILLAVSAAATVKGLKDRTAEGRTYHYLSVFYVSAVVVYAILYAVTSMEYVVRYNLPITVFSYVVILMGIRSVTKDQMNRMALYLLLLGMLFLGSARVFTLMIRSDFTRNQRAIVEKVTGEGYRWGVGTFWNGNLFTELSDGNLEMYVPEKLGDLRTMNGWLQKKDHRSGPGGGKVFAVFTRDELNNCGWKNMPGDEKLLCSFEQYSVPGFYEYPSIYRTSSYLVYGFENYDEMLEYAYGNVY